MTHSIKPGINRTRKPLFEEFEQVSLKKDVLDGGTFIPKGTVGLILHRMQAINSDSYGYIVGFNRSENMPTLHEHEIGPVPPKPEPIRGPAKRPAAAPPEMQPTAKKPAI